MLICIDQRTGTGCGYQSDNTAQVCARCGKSLRFALHLLDSGTVVGSYRVLRLIGHGGFGAVYEAESARQPEILVALKETFDTDSVRSFHSEFDTLSQLRHPNLPRYYEMFEANGNGYLVMEYVPGQSLEQILLKQQGPLVESQVLGYAMQLCDVLTYLHTHVPPIIHRDIKPANIRLTPEGLIKLVDFGLLKQGTATTASSRRGLTPAYAPLEQWGAGGMHTDARSDIYSLGATFYHLLTGQAPPCATDRIAASTDPILQVPILQINRQLSKQIALAIMTAIELLPNRRYNDAIGFKEALIRRNDMGPTTTPAASIAPNGPSVTGSTIDLAKQEVQVARAPISPERKPARDKQTRRRRFIATTLSATMAWSVAMLFPTESQSAIYLIVVIWIAGAILIGNSLRKSQSQVWRWALIAISVVIGGLLTSLGVSVKGGDSYLIVMLYPLLGLTGTVIWEMLDVLRVHSWQR
jgi:serine/threonine protein kinase